MALIAVRAHDLWLFRLWLFHFTRLGRVSQLCQVDVSEVNNKRLEVSTYRYTCGTEEVCVPLEHQCPWPDARNSPPVSLATLRQTWDELGWV